MPIYLFQCPPWSSIAVFSLGKRGEGFYDTGSVHGTETAKLHGGGGLLQVELLPRLQRELI